MGDFLKSFATPAIVSLLMSLWAGRLMEARRARRDHITKLFEVVRDDVRRSTELAIDYFAAVPAQRTGLQEARVLAVDKELRASLPLLLDKVRSTQSEIEFDKARVGFETLLLELTGGNFQSLAGEIDRPHIIRLAHAGANLRVALARLRDAELRARADGDPILMGFNYVRAWIKDNNPFRQTP